MNRTRAIPSALRRALLPLLAAGLITLAGCSDESDAASDATIEPPTSAERSIETSTDASKDASTDTSAGSSSGTATDASNDTSTDAPDDTTSESTSNASGDSSTDAPEDVGDLGAVGSLDSAIVHTISVELDEPTYDAMIETYTSTEEKQWIEATVTIDGATYEQVGMRLKGNSSLRGISGNGGGGLMGEGGSAEQPETLPWLIDLDKFVDGQHHDGLVEFVVRSNNSKTSLNEAVALELLSLAGLASQDAAATAFSVNGSDGILRLVIDNPDDEWMAEQLDASGALYKAESTGDYSYRGDDPESYDEVFDQEAGKDNADLTPLIGFLQFINESDDATFEAELPDHLDVERFAIYLAMQDLLANFDDIDGPGNNSYLFYDVESGRFTVVPWDYNLAFGAGPGGTGGGPGGGAFPGGGPWPTDGEFPASPPGGGSPRPPAGGEFPEPPADGEMPQRPTGRDGGAFPGGPGGGFGARSNVLVERLLAVPEWNELYEQQLADLRAELFDSGTAQRVLDQWSSIVASSGLVNEDTITSEAERIAEHF